MKSLAAAVIAAIALVSFARPASAEQVRVTITGVEARGGEILASLQTEDEFMQPRGHYGVIVPAPTANGDVVIEFNDVAPGTYSFSAMHDVNGDRQMQRQENGRPLEGWAMHNGASLRARPEFGQVSFTVGAAPVTLTEPMIYPQAH